MKRTSKIKENANPLFYHTACEIFVVEDLGLINCNNRQHEISFATNTVAILRVVLST